MTGPEIITPNSPKTQLSPLEQLVIKMLNQVNTLTLEFDSLFEMFCDTEEKKQAFKKLMEAKVQAYNEKVKSSQIKRQIMQK